jgi:hypothetical protein
MISPLILHAVATLFIFTAFAKRRLAITFDRFSKFEPNVDRQ